MRNLTEETMDFFLTRHRSQVDRWSKMNDYDIDQLIVKHMSRGDKIEWLEVNQPREMDEFYDMEDKW